VGHQRCADRLHGRNGTGAQAETTKEAQRAGIAHARANGDARAAYRGRKPSHSRKQFESAQAMLGKSASVGEVARVTGPCTVAERSGRSLPDARAETLRAIVADARREENTSVRRIAEALNKRR
jgi:hypothetical protein